MKNTNKVLVNYRITPELAERIRKAAHYEEISRTEFVARCIKEKVSKIEKKMSLLT